MISAVAFSQELRKFNAPHSYLHKSRREIEVSVITHLPTLGCLFFRRYPSVTTKMQSPHLYLHISWQEIEVCIKTPIYQYSFVISAVAFGQELWKLQSSYSRTYSNNKEKLKFTLKPLFTDVRFVFSAVVVSQKLWKFNVSNSRSYIDNDWKFKLPSKRSFIDVHLCFTAIVIGQKLQRCNAASTKKLKLALNSYLLKFLCVFWCSYQAETMKMQCDEYEKLLLALKLLFTDISLCFLV